MSRGKPPFWIVLRAHFRADPRKTAVLVVLAAVMVVVLARLYHKTGVPSSADAFVGSALQGGEHPSASRGGAVPEPPETRARVALPALLAAELDRNPFAVNLDRFPVGGGVTGPGASASPEASSSGEDKDIQDAVGGLVLQSTICGDWPLACINGCLVRPGQEIEGFVVKRVEPMRVILRRGETEVTLSLE